MPDAIALDRPTTARTAGPLRRAAALLTVLAACAAALIGAAPTASAVTVQQLYGLQAENPYVHRDIAGRKWIYGASSKNATQYATVRSTLYQYYGGRWNAVAQNSASGGTYTVRVIASVLCTGALTNYSWYTRAEVYYNGRWYGQNSGVVTRSC